VEGTKGRRPGSTVLKTKDFAFDLPDDLIAQAPPATRGLSRLMVLDPARGVRDHRTMANLVDLVAPGTFMVFNDTRVRKARVFGKTTHGGRVEVLFLRPLPEGRWECLVSKAKRLRQGQELELPGVIARIESPEGNVRTLSFDPPVTDKWLESYGRLPLPPYIRRSDTEADSERYQTVYAQEPGSAAAPTAGLHFTEELMSQLRSRDVELAFVTLEVGLGTFLPVRATDVKDHKMHTERYRIDDETAVRLNVAQKAGRPLLAVGTTSLRTLESAWRPEGFTAGTGATDLFITPGYRFRAVDQLFTNFHTPESTLLMLVCAFAGKDFLLDSYREAVAQRYRFFSYGDAMLIKNRG
jgi:S-adenosylmethionine:tRNA ribosyltransferase-isomerase